MIDLQDIALFFSGVAAWESVTHLSLLVSKQEPVVFGIRLTRRLNIIQTIVPALVAILLAWWALS